MNIMDLRDIITYDQCKEYYPEIMEKVRIVDIPEDDFDKRFKRFNTLSQNLRPLYQIDELVLDDFSKLVLYYTALRLGYATLEDDEIVYTELANELLAEHERKEIEREAYRDTVVAKIRCKRNESVNEVLKANGFIHIYPDVNIVKKFQPCYYHIESDTFYMHYFASRIEKGYITIKNGYQHKPNADDLTEIRKQYTHIFRKQKIKDFLND